jgi:membrane protein required for colicin V production
MEGLPFTLTDLAVLAVVVVSGLLALSRGFVREVFALLTWLGAGLATLYGFPYIKPYAHQIIPVPWAADTAGAVGLFLAAFVVISLLSRPITGRVRKSDFRGLDRSLGFFFGLLRGAVLVSLAYLLVTWIWPVEDQPRWVREARVLPYVAGGAEFIRSLVPAEMAEAGAQAVGEAGETVRQGIESGQAIQTLTNPSTTGGAADEPSGYDNKERREMNRLFESSQ